MKQLYVVLGASDVEMSSIRAILARFNIPFGYAGVEGKRVKAHQAYGSCELITDEGTRTSVPSGTEVVVLVECNPPENLLWEGVVVKVDHHYLGDGGWEVPPSQALHGSSIGQLIAVMAKLGVELPWKQVFAESTVAPTGTMKHHPLDGWVVSTQRGKEVVWVKIPQAFVNVAAADHCLCAAYRGRVPGVDPEELFKHRCRVLGNINSVTAEEMEENLLKKTLYMRDLGPEYWERLDVSSLKGLGKSALVLSGADSKLLSEAAAYLGFPCLITLDGGTLKTSNLLACRTHLRPVLDAFVNEWCPANGYVVRMDLRFRGMVLVSRQSA